VTLRRFLRTRAEQTHARAAVGSRRRATLALTTLLTAAAALLLTAAPAFAEPERTYDSKIIGFHHPGAIAIDTADNVWIDDLGGKGPISEYGPYPSQTKIGERTGQVLGEGSPPCPGCISSIVVDSANGALYLNVNAVDNSGGESNGHLFGIIGEAIGAYNTNDEPVDFSAHEPYIHENEINEGFSTVYGLAVDSTGNIYVSYPYYIGATLEFNSSGELVQEFGATNEFSKGSIAVDPTNGDVLITTNGSTVIKEFSPAGKYLGEINKADGSPFGRIEDIAINSEGRLYVSDGAEDRIDIFNPKVVVPKVENEAPTSTTPTSAVLNATINPNSGGNVTSCHFEYGTSTYSSSSFSFGPLPCLSDKAGHEKEEVGTLTNPIESKTKVHADLTPLTTDTTYYYRAVAGNAAASRPGLIQSFTPRWVQDLQTGSATEVTNKSAELHGEYQGIGEETEYYFEYGTSTAYGLKSSSAKATATGPQSVSATVGVGAEKPLEPGVTYHYRVVASTGSGRTTYGSDRTFRTIEAPTIEGISSSGVGATTADLHADINPQGAETHYYFEYGPNTKYGSYAPLPPPGEEIGAGEEAKSVEADLTGLEKGATYHFRVIAESQYGVAVSEDQTFGFYPPSCPNAHLRQITHSSRLPDCRAYELVSPEYAGSANLYPEGPNSPTATSPSRLAFGGVVGAVPGAGDPPDSIGDLYVATRTNQGWVTKYVGLSGKQTLMANGPPNEPISVGLRLLNSPAGTRGDTSLSKFLDWNDGARGLTNPQLPANYTPYVWSAEGTSLGQWPTAPGYAITGENPVFEESADFTHFVFQAPTSPTISLIDNDTETGTSTTVSVLPGGGPIPLEAGDTEPNYESLTIPAISTNGSHILMSVRGEGHELCEEENEGGNGPVAIKCPPQPGHLYMRVNDTVTYDVSEGHIVSYFGMTPDGSKVYFTSKEHLTGQDLNHGGTSLYMWSAEKAEEEEPALTLISKGEREEPGAPGDTAACNASWTTECGIVPYENNGYSQLNTFGSPLGNGHSDNSIAATNGDIYFFSPERLVGEKGAAGQENLYDYRNGRLQYVTTLPPKPFCASPPAAPFEQYCSVGPVVRMQVTPTDSRMAFLTAAQITSYNNAKHLEMYIYDPASGQVKCVSCLPDGEPPTTNVKASSDGIFMTNDGRVFFSTGDPLVPQDTDGLRDTYEYVEGHAQLISSGTSSKDHTYGVLLGTNSELFEAGLVGVSAKGTDAYFTTFDTLVGQDRNGNALKFYDARVDGGFPFQPPPPPCEAADECHGPGSGAEAAFPNGSETNLGGGGNVADPSGAAKHKHRRKRRHHAKKHHYERHAAQPRGRGR
jgi:hypothetical protein